VFGEPVKLMEITLREDMRKLQLLASYEFAKYGIDQCAVGERVEKEFRFDQRPGREFRPMDTESVVRQTFAALDSRDIERFRALVHPEAEDRFLAVGTFTGREAIVAFFREMFAAVPDARLEVRRVVASGDVAAVEWTMRGTFSGGAFQGIQPTGKSVEIDGVDVIEVRDGLQYRNSIYYDGASFARQIGMLPPLGSRGDRTLLALFNARTRLRRRR
jgi:steroid delta-isomerase-like uncharacterized protein